MKPRFDGQDDLTKKLTRLYFNTQNGIEEKNATRSPSITDPHTLVFGRAPFP